MTAPTYAWEPDLCRRWRGLARAYAGRVFTPHRLGMDREDLEQELMLALLTGARTFAEDNGGDPPPDALAATILVRRRLFYQRMRGAQKRAAPTVSYPLPTPDDDGFYELDDPSLPTAAEQAERREAEDVKAGLVYALRRSLPPAAFAVLHLRFIEEMEVGEIAELTGLAAREDRASPKTSARVARAVDAALQVLADLGVEEYADAEEVVHARR